MRNRAVIWAVICFLLGHISAAMQDLSLWLLICSGIVILLLLLAISGIGSWKLIGLLLALFLFGALERYIVDSNNQSAVTAHLALASPVTEHRLHDQGEDLSIIGKGVIASEVEVDGNIVAFTFQVNDLHILEPQLTINEKEMFVVRLVLEQEEEVQQALAWRRGMKITLQGNISKPPTENNEGMFNYRDYLLKKGIHWLWRSKGSSSLQVIDGGWSYSQLLQYVDQARNRLAAPLDSLYNEAESGYLKGLIIGIRADLDPEQFRSFSKLGLTHILAISGLHVAVFMYILTLMLKWLRCSKELIITLLLFAVPCYVALTGASPSVLRAGMMAVLGLLAARAGKLKDGLNIIAIVAGLLVLCKPYLLHDISFQLSFIVTLGLIIGVPAMQKVMPQSPRWKWLVDSLTVTIVAQIVSFPLSIYYFNQFHLLSLLANLVLVPFISMIVMPLASFSLVLGHLSVAFAKPFSTIVHWCNEFSFVIVELLSKITRFHTIWASPSLLWILLWYGVWFYLFHYWRSKSSNANRVIDDLVTEPLEAVDELAVIYMPTRQGWWVTYHKTVIGLTVVLSMLVYCYFPQQLQTSATVSFLDVGQGDASLIRTPSGKMLLIDGGGTVQFGQQEEWKQRKDPFEVGKNVLLPLLMKRGVHNLDVVIITHLDSDHIGGLIEVVKHIPIKQIWWNGSYKPSSEAEQLFQLIVQKDIPLKVPLIGERISIDRYTHVDMLWPSSEQPKSIDNVSEQNEYSLVFLLTLYSTTLLYTGDINSETEEVIIHNHRLAVERAESVPLPQIQIMKAAHHGSRFSTDYSWLSYFQPNATVISAGRNNMYGHPHQDVLGRLIQYKSLVWRTDLQGEIQFIIGKKRSYYLNWN